MIFSKNKLLISILLLLNTSLTVLGKDSHTILDALNNDVIVVDDTDESSLFSKFTDTDWSEFLNDHGITKLTKEKSKSLKDYCSSKWHELISDENYENSPDYLSSWFNSIKDSDLVHDTKEKIKDAKLTKDIKDKVGSFKQSSDDISSWLFDSWDVESLRNFLKKNNIYLSQDLSTTHDKDKLVKVCKENFKYLSNRVKASGYYLSNGYLDSWSDNDLTTWLDKYKIKHQKKASSDDLKKLVKENLYKVSGTLKKTKSDLLKNLDVDSWSGDLLNKSKNKDAKIQSLLDNLSKPDLVKWLKSHNIDFDEKFNFNSDKDLAKFIKDNNYIDYLSNDISDYLAEKKSEFEKHGDSLLKKSSKQISSQLDNLKSKSEDNFEDLKDWSIENLEILQKDLSSKYNIASKKTYETKDEILKNIEKIKKDNEDTFNDYYDQVVSSLTKQTGHISSFFNDWSLDNLKKWAGDSASTINDNKNELVEKSKDKFDQLYSSNKKEAHNKAKDLKNFWDETLDSWSTEDLKEYLVNLKKKKSLMMMKALSVNWIDSNCMKNVKKTLYGLLLPAITPLLQPRIVYYKNFKIKSTLLDQRFLT
ncbi:Meiotic sister chromatid recombination protein 1 [Hanseniaspora uvarum DSM 2768]|nr:Meiotic sister chromatid recombination protein 1 [Hanseniaspora uvarum DSM 2768]